MTIHYHVGVGFMNSGALMGFIPDKSAPSYVTAQEAMDVARDLAVKEQKSLEAQGHSVDRMEGEGYVTLEWFMDHYERGRMFQVTECEVAHPESSDGQ